MTRQFKIPGLFCLQILVAMVVAGCAAQQAPSTPDAVNADSVQTWIIDASTVECTGVGAQTCLRIKKPGDSEFTLFYGAIEGFSHQPGVEYVLKVRQSPVANPPADGSSLRTEKLETVAMLPRDPDWTPGLENTPWTLETVRSPEGRIVLAEDTGPPVVEPGGGKILGNSGCSRLVGVYGLSAGNGLILSAAPLSAERCAAPVMTRQSRLLTAFPATASFRILDTRLLLYDAGKRTVASFRWFPAASIYQTRWALVSYRDRYGELVQTTDEIITLVIGRRGEISGFGGCNRYFSSLVAGAESVPLDPPGTTRKLCDRRSRAVIDREAVYLDALGRTSRYTLEPQKLTLHDGDGKKLAVYRRLVSP